MHDSMKVYICHHYFQMRCQRGWSTLGLKVNSLNQLGGFKDSDLWSSQMIRCIIMHVKVKPYNIHAWYILHVHRRNRPNYIYGCKRWYICLIQHEPIGNVVYIASHKAVGCWRVCWQHGNRFSGTKHQTCRPAGLRIRKKTPIPHHSPHLILYLVENQDILGKALHKYIYIYIYIKATTPLCFWWRT
jgi:hypothetical protein